ncbi:preprotein translocase subunit SecE [Patescibacteria group bacterium]|nr:preprotein translocase subunit SecE [Patescibacteria group bacterium]MBU4452949.1 preprotein translocase subunit SecE [Patescibacteria group bacterium]
MTKLFTDNRLVKYLRESKQELEKVSWPTKQQTQRYAIIVVIFCLGLAVYFGVLDWALNLGLRALINLTA